MARDVEKNVFLYFYDPESGIFTGEVGGAGDSDDFTLPSGMTPIPPPTAESNEQAIFDTDLQTWSVEYINPYDGLTQPEKDIWDAAQAKQQAIDAAQDVVTAEHVETTNAVIGWMEERFTIPQTDFDFVNGMTDIADVKIAVTGILNKLNLDAGDLAFIASWKTKYDAWKTAQE